MYRSFRTGDGDKERGTLNLMVSVGRGECLGIETRRWSRSWNHTPRVRSSHGLKVIASSRWHKHLSPEKKNYWDSIHMVLYGRTFAQRFHENNIAEDKASALGLSYCNFRTVLAEFSVPVYGPCPPMLASWRNYLHSFQPFGAGTYDALNG
jgi:hypothetical protein